MKICYRTDKFLLIIYKSNSNFFAIKTRGYIFLIFRHVCWGGGGEKFPKKYNIDYFGYAVNLELKFKLNLDPERGKK